MELHRILCNDKVAMDETTGNHFELPFPLKKIPPRDASSFVGASQKFDEVDRVNSYSMYVTPKASEVVESSDRQSPGNVIERKIRKRAATLLALANTSRRKMKAEPAVDKRMLALGKKPSSKQFVAHLVKSSVESSSGNTNDAAVKADYMCVARINSQCRIMLTEENANTQCKSEIVNDLQCTIVDCKRAALSGKLCALHGGGSRCIVADCGKLVVSKNRCRKHGGGLRCHTAGCTKSAQSGSKNCWNHGGGRRCKIEGCNKAIRKNNLCCRHYSKHVEEMNRCQ